jgi:hypothetical protein
MLEIKKSKKTEFIDSSATTIFVTFQSQLAPFHIYIHYVNLLLKLVKINDCILHNNIGVICSWLLLISITFIHC